MIVAQISDQLGNQMFAYASVKTIAQDKGEPFHFIQENSPRINDTDQKYGNNIQTVFPHIKNEFLDELPEQVINTYREQPIYKRQYSFQEAALDIPTDTLMIGHFISYRYFAHNLDNVRAWFIFPKDIEQSVANEIIQLRTSNPGRSLVAVHFRVGEDYVRQGFRLQDRYWFDAADHIKSQLPDPLFLVFYDKKNKTGGIVNRFLQTYDCRICRGSLIHDLCMMSKCDKQIICNSSFSIMSAVLNSRPDKEIIRPSIYPCGQYFLPTDCFADEWTVIPARQSLYSRHYYLWMCLKGKLRKLIFRA